MSTAIATHRSEHWRNAPPRPAQSRPSPPLNVVSVHGSPTSGTVECGAWQTDGRQRVAVRRAGWSRRSCGDRRRAARHPARHDSTTTLGTILDDELRRRYGGDYEVVTCRGYDHGRAVLDGLRHWGRDVAMVFACYSHDDRRARLPAPGPRPPSLCQAGASWSGGATSTVPAPCSGPSPRDTPNCSSSAPSGPGTRSSTAPSPTSSTTGTSAQGTRLRGGAHHRAASTSAPTCCGTAFGRNHIPIGFYDADTEAGRRMLDGLGLDGRRAAGARPRSSPRRPRRWSTPPTSRSPTPSG